MTARTDSATTSQPLTRLEMSQMSYGVEGKPILSDISLDISFNRLGVVGRNGSGKSTLARLLAGLVAPDSGQISLNGTDLFKDRKAALSAVGILFQNPEHQIIFPTVIEEIAFGLGQQGRSTAEAEEAARQTLIRFGKAHWEASYVNSLSQGQKHLLCLMAVTAMAPKLIILDEPFAGLDIPTKAQLRRYLTLFAGNIIHITHDPSDLRDYEHVLWVDQGRLRCAGPQSRILPKYVAAMEEIGQADDIADLSG